MIFLHNLSPGCLGFTRLVIDIILVFHKPVTLALHIHLVILRITATKISTYTTFFSKPMVG